jgi:thioredoxin
MEDAETQSVLSAIIFGMLLEDNSQDTAIGTLQVLSKIVSNAIGNSDAKFRKLPATNEKIQSKIINVSGASEFLDAIGFVRQQDGAGDFVLADDSKLRLGASVLNEALSTIPQAPVATKPASETRQSTTTVSKSSESGDSEYEQRKREAEARQAEIRRKQEEDKRKKEALRLQIKAEQREVRDRPVVASHAVHITRNEPGGGGGGGDGKIRYTNTDREFQSVVGSKPAVIANFTASWCGPCQAIAPMVEEMAKNNPNVTFIKIDIDENSETSSRFNVSAVPTFILFKNGKMTAEVKGANAQAVQGLVAQA